MRKCAPSPRYFDLVGPVTTVHIPCILGSDTGCMTQVIYKWTHIIYIGNTLMRCFWMLIVSETLQVDREIRHVIN